MKSEIQKSNVPSTNLESFRQNYKACKETKTTVKAGQITDFMINSRYINRQAINPIEVLYCNNKWIHGVLGAISGTDSRAHMGFLAHSAPRHDVLERTEDIALALKLCFLLKTLFS